MRGCWDPAAWLPLPPIRLLECTTLRDQMGTLTSPAGFTTLKLRAPPDEYLLDLAGQAATDPLPMPNLLVGGVRLDGSRVEP